MNKKLTQAFTMIELLAVMVIILVLAGLFVGVGGPARESAKKRKAEVMISALEVAIGMYKADTGSYPATDGGSGCANLYDGLTNLNHGVVGNPAYIAGWSGRYMEFKKGDLNATETEILDPWSRAYNYETPGTNNNQSFDLWSTGEDVGDAADDRTNW